MACPCAFGADLKEVDFYNGNADDSESIRHLDLFSGSKDEMLNQVQHDCKIITDHKRSVSSAFYKILFILFKKFLHQLLVGFAKVIECGFGIIGISRFRVFFHDLQVKRFGFSFIIQHRSLVV